MRRPLPRQFEPNRGIGRADSGIAGGPDRAIAERVLGRLTDEEVRDVSDDGALGDAIANLNYTLGNLKCDAADWEAHVAYGPRSAGTAA